MRFSASPPSFFYCPPPLCALCSVLPAVAVCCAACRAPVARLALMWAAARCAVFFRVASCVLCRAPPCCWLLLCAVARLWSCCPAALFALWVAASPWPAVLCPWLLCSVALPRAVLWCTGLLFLAPFGAAACCVLPSGPPPALGRFAFRRFILPRLSVLCALRRPCFAVGFWCVLLIAAVRCAVCVLGCRAVRCARLVLLSCAVSLDCVVSGAWCRCACCGLLVFCDAVLRCVAGCVVCCVACALCCVLLCPVTGVPRLLLCAAV